jgi:hypothetical protein
MEKTNYLHYVKFKLNLTHQDQVKKDAPWSSMMAKMWHDNGVRAKTYIKFEQCIKYLYNASNKQYASNKCFAHSCNKFFAL